MIKTRKEPEEAKIGKDKDEDIEKSVLRRPLFGAFLSSKGNIECEKRLWRGKVWLSGLWGKKGGKRNYHHGIS